MYKLGRKSGVRLLVWVLLGCFLWLTVGVDCGWACNTCPGTPKCQADDSSCPTKSCASGAIGSGGPAAVDTGGCQSGSCSQVFTVYPSSGNLLVRTSGSVGFPDLGGGMECYAKYSSVETTTGTLGAKWRTDYDTKLTFNSSTQIMFTDVSGTRYTFNQDAAGNWIPETGYYGKLVQGTSYYTLTFGDGTQFDYNLSSGRLERARDAGGTVRVMTYDSNGRITQAAMAYNTNRKLTFSYSSAGKLTSVADFTGRTMSFTTTAAGGWRV